MKLDKSDWSRPNFSRKTEPHFLFIITPPNSGSTALLKLINSSHKTTILQNKGEGQWLIPEMCKNDRWDPEKKIDYESVRSVWLNKFQEIKRLFGNVDVVIEKSPPNMMRIEELLSTFTKHSLLANNRDPYANCASILYRYHDADNLDADERIRKLHGIAGKWIQRSERIRKLVIKLDIPLLTYEDFCHSPSSVISKLQLPEGVSETINPEATVKVKDYEVQQISNQNQRQVSKLINDELDYLKKMLAKHEELLSFFGY